MHSPKDFLLLECDSVRSVLQETLRHEYGAGGSREFFEECETRLDFIKQEISGTPDADHQRLQTNAGLLNALSDLIARIERSSIGEYSWPFVDEVKKIASAICTENTLANANTPPTVRVLSDGGLDKYLINVEQKRPFGGKRRILTIVFPRSLKHFVLLHPVLGHELGHAIRGSQYEARLVSIIETNLIQTSVKFRDAASTAAWLYSPATPADFKANLPNVGPDPARFFAVRADWESWKEELVCDLIGLVTFGPSFVAALCQLLYSLAPSGLGYGPYHPPVACRANLMLSAMRLLGYDKANLSDARHSAAANNFWSWLDAHRKPDPWFDLFTDQNILATLDALRAWLGNHAPALYERPASDLVEKLLTQLGNQTPPVGFELDDDGTPRCTEVDFRHILYAGWISCHSPGSTTFAKLNRLCEHAIMQQKAISIFGARP